MKNSASTTTAIVHKPVTVEGRWEVMEKCRITVMKKALHTDLSAKYENPIEHACALEIGQSFISENGEKPDGFCESAWQSLFPFVFALAHGGENFFDGWMKDKHSAMISCNDGFRPVSFYIEVIHEPVC